MNTDKKNIDLDQNLNSYNYELNPSLIAHTPTTIRHESRMMIVNNNSSLNSYSLDKLTLNIVDEFWLITFLANSTCPEVLDTVSPSQITIP